jgi:hypothetical protein
MESIKVIGVSDGKVSDVSFALNFDNLKRLAVNPETFENPNNGKKNHSQGYMIANAGIRVVNNKGNLEVWEVSNHNSFFATSKIFDFSVKAIELPYILGIRVRGLLK